MASTLASKLQLKPGARLRVENGPAAALEQLGRELPGIEVASADAGSPREGALLVFVANYDETIRFAAAALASAAPEATVWIAYPKGSSGVKTDVNRDVLWKTLARTGWRPVRQVALDDTWTAMRFRPLALVGRTPGEGPNLDAAPRRRKQPSEP